MVFLCRSVVDGALRGYLPEWNVFEVHRWMVAALFGGYISIFDSASHWPGMAEWNEKEKNMKVGGSSPPRTQEKKEKKFHSAGRALGSTIATRALPAFCFSFYTDKC
jgi:hypothetical protein